MKFGIIGSGRMADHHAQAIRRMQGSTLHSIVGRRVEAAEELAAKQGAKAFARLEEFLADPELEVVTVATPSGAHLEPVLAAAKAGKHVVVERPLEVNVERVDRMIQGCREAGVLLSGISSQRFSPAVDALKTAIVEGRFGTLTMADAFVKSFRGEAHYSASAWRGNSALGGGVFLDEGVDAIDLLLHLAGEVAAVWATAACLAHADLDVEDTGVAMLEFHSGARGLLQCATSGWCSDPQPMELRLSGENGSVSLVGGHFRTWDFQDHAPMDYDVRATLMAGSKEAEESVSLGLMGHQRNFEDVVRAIGENREPLVSGSEARRAVALICALYESARNDGRRVDFPGLA